MSRWQYAPNHGCKKVHCPGFSCCHSQILLSVDNNFIINIKEGFSYFKKDTPDPTQFWNLQTDKKSSRRIKIEFC